MMHREIKGNIMNILIIHFRVFLSFNLQVFNELVKCQPLVGLVD